MEERQFLKNISRNMNYPFDDVRENDDHVIIGGFNERAVQQRKIGDIFSLIFFK